MDVPSGYDRVFVSDRGELVANWWRTGGELVPSNDPSFDPNVTFQEQFRELQKQR